MLQVQIPTDKSKILNQIQALKYQIRMDTNEKDKVIHQKALIELEKHLKAT